MAFDTSELLKAQNQAEQNTENHNPGNETSHANTASQENQTVKGHEASGESGDVFQQLYKGLGDHYGMILGPYHVSDLPMIFIDEGFHFYPSVKAMESDGKFIMEHHHPVRAQDHQPPALDMSITNFVFFQFLAMIILAFVFVKAGRNYKKNPDRAPKGLANLLEMAVLFIKNDIVKPNLPNMKITERLLPYFVGLFFFIFLLNLFGLMPFGHTATSSIAVTCGLAVTAFITINVTAIRESGIGSWFKHLLGGAPWWMFPIMVPIEILSMFIKPFALTIRLFANMSAGHVVLLSILGLLFYFKSIFISPAVVGFSVFIYLLELLVVYIQTYVFTMLTAIFVGLAIGSHGHEEHAHA